MSNGNMKWYGLNDVKVVVGKGPSQMLGIIEWMKKNKIDANNGMRGSEIGKRAVADGDVVTNKLSGEVIFAYYARRMEREYGLVRVEIKSDEKEVVKVD